MSRRQGMMGGRQGWCWRGVAAGLAVAMPEREKDGNAPPVGTARRDHARSEVAGLWSQECLCYWSRVEGDNP